jgi:4a-hydroxytetrahydrobiopterin dehydratase
MNHHPDLAISWNTVECTLTTHSQGGLTETDFELAGRIDALA